MKSKFHLKKESCSSLNIKTGYLPDIPIQQVV